jgi:hypothetical protein
MKESKFQNREIYIIFKSDTNENFGYVERIEK